MISNSKSIRLLCILLLTFSFAGYLEWGGNHQEFIFQMEKEVLCNGIKKPNAILHPFVLLPLIGQILLVICIFITILPRPLLVIAASAIGLLFALILFSGLTSLNWKIVLSVAPFFTAYFILLKKIYSATTRK